MNWLLLNPGPVNLIQSVRDAAVGIDFCHRQEEFIEILLDVKARLLKLANREHTHISMLHGSGTLAVESALQSLVRGKILVINNGNYCLRISNALSDLPDTVVTIAECGFGLAPNLDDLPDLSCFDWVAVVHHETSTGLLNPLNKICDMAKSCGTKVFVDAVSSFGAHIVDERADVVCFNSNKCLESLPGVAIVLWNDSLECYKVNNYMRLSNYIDNKIPYTPNTNAVVALQEALKCYDNEDRIRRYKMMSEHIRNIGSKYFELLLKDNYSNVLTSFVFNGNYNKLYNVAKFNGYILYPGKMGNYFRVANINPMLTPDCIDILFNCIGECK